jgi:hypothetical protein
MTFQVDTRPLERSAASHSAGSDMTNLLTDFDSDKIDLGKRIEAASGIEDVVKLTDGYLSGLHRSLSGVYPLQKARNAGYLLEILRYAVRTLNTVDKELLPAEFRPSESRTGHYPKRFTVFVKTVQLALILTLLMTLLSIASTPWIPILLVLILLGTEVYLHIFAWRGSVSKKNSDCYLPDEKPQFDVQLKIAHVHAYLNCIADALSYVDKAMDETASKKESGFLEKETQVLKLFQDLFEAKAFDDGEWALKKILNIQAILWKQEIAVKEFDPGDPADISIFDVEPGADPSIDRHVTIRPAFIKNNRVLLRGRVAAPFSSVQNHSI